MADRAHASGPERLIAELCAQGIRDERVLAALRRVPRDRFVPEEHRAEAWDDRALPLSQGQTISQPFVVACMTEALALSGTEKVLEIGTGSGYQAAVLAECAREVLSIEILPSLARRAAELLAELGYANVRVRAADGWSGWPEEAPFDAILVAAAPREIPEPLVAQLSERGRMVLPLGGRDQSLVCIEHKSGGLVRRSILPVRFVPMTGRAELPNTRRDES